jgi:von Willebrand factor type A domain
MKSMNGVIGFVCLAALAACSAEESTSDGPGGGAGVGGDFSNAPPSGSPAGKCTAGTQACYCPDGTASGTQACDARQELSSCVCPQTSGISSAGVKGDPTRVCADLQGQPGCDATSYVSPQLPSSILFVVDRSGSMACNAPPVQDVADCELDPKRKDPSQPSRWETTVAALNEAFTGLSGSNAALGLSLFSTDGFCGVDSTPVVGVDAVTPLQLTALSNAMAASTPAGGTPIVGGTILAYNHLHQELRAQGNRYVVLITDGAESCGTKGDNADTADLAAARARLLDVEVRKARDANIKTFVIGSPGSDAARGFLSELAFLGGTSRSPDCTHGDRDGDVGDCHFDLSKETDFAAVLRESLGKISGEALGCEFQTPPGGSSLVNVQYSQNGGAPSCFTQDTRPCEGGADGWQFAKDAAGNDDYSRVVLCGPACELVKSDPTSVVDVILGCQVLE